MFQSEKNYWLNQVYALYQKLSVSQKRKILALLDIVSFCIAIGIALLLRFNYHFSILMISKYFGLMIILIFFKLIIFKAQGVYRPILRYSGLELVSKITKAVFYSSSLIIVLAYLSRLWPLLPRTVLMIDAFVTLFLVVSGRLLIRQLSKDLIAFRHANQALERLLIYGAGAAGSQLAQALSNNTEYRIVAYVDDRQDLKQQIVLQGFKIYPATELPKLWSQQMFDTVILAMPSVEKARKRQIVERLEDLSIPVKTIPSLEEIISGKVEIQKIRNIDILDLLGRPEVTPDRELMQLKIKDKVVLVTGAGGSIGSELCRQIVQQQPKCLILYELSEFALYNIDLELAEAYPQVQRFAYLGNVIDQKYFSYILKTHQVETIYHAAAYKHVPLVESNASRGIENNVLGTWNTARCAIECQVNNFVLISTDKAVRPTNVMGASKRVAELVVQAFANQPSIDTCFAIVRFGNVLDSSGSVIPRFRKQIAQFKPITLTHANITRYFMSIPEAARLVIQAGAMAKGGEVFLLDMGEPVRIYDLAVRMIRLSGLVPQQDIEIKITGLRPGEKLYEELLISGDNIQKTRHSKVFSAHEYFEQWETLQFKLEDLLEKARFNDSEGIISQLQKIVPEYKKKKSQSSKVSSPKQVTMNSGQASLSDSSANL